MAASGFLTKLAEIDFLQNLLKITVKKIISQQSFSQKFLRNYFLALVAAFLKITPLQVLSQFKHQDRAF